VIKVLKKEKKNGFVETICIPPTTNQPKAEKKPEESFIYANYYIGKVLYNSNNAVKVS
jgi:hypothetical protein